MFSARGVRFASVITALVVAFSMVSIDFAEARPRGSFGSRGTRTFQSAPPTTTVPHTVAPVQRSMTPQSQTAAPGMQQQAQSRGGFFGGFGGSLFRGLVFGGLLGMLFGGGFGGLGGIFSLFFQVLLIGGGIWLLLNFMRSRSMTPASAQGPGYGAPRQAHNPLGGLGSLGGGSSNSGRTTGARRPANPDELGITPRDLDTFEGLLADLQESYGREDYDALRHITTPEMMGYLAEQLGQNATKGVKNDIADVKLLQGDVAESWREGGRDYATVAMRYELRDVTRDRNSGQVVDGSDEQLTEATELWTFVRDRGNGWKLSAIQEA